MYVYMKYKQTSIVYLVFSRIREFIMRQFRELSAHRIWAVVYDDVEFHVLCRYTCTTLIFPSRSLRKIEKPNSSLHSWHLKNSYRGSAISSILIIGREKMTKWRRRWRGTMDGWMRSNKFSGRSQETALLSRN